MTERSPSHGGADRNSSMAIDLHSPLVALSRGRGSKRLRMLCWLCRTWSPSHGGADRNINQRMPPIATPTSPSHGGADRNCTGKLAPIPVGVALSLGRGSKRLNKQGLLTNVEVALSRGRGSKRSAPRLQVRPPGRPLTGARIETVRLARCVMASAVALSRGRGSKRAKHRGHCERRDMSPSHGGADRNRPLRSSPPFLLVALSRGRGSKRERHHAAEGRRRSPSHGGADRNEHEAG